MQLLYKILSAEEWQTAISAGRFLGSAIDLRDGFIHLSAAHQMRETAARHFGGREGLVLVAFPDDRLKSLKWEQSRGGDLFPHVYEEIPADAAIWVKPLPLSEGVHRFPDEVGP